MIPVLPMACLFPRLAFWIFISQVHVMYFFSQDPIFREMSNHNFQLNPSADDAKTIFNLNSTCLFSFARRLSLCKSFLHLTTVKCFLHMHWLKADVCQTFTFLLVQSAFLYMKFKQWNTQLDLGSSPGSSRYFFVNTWGSHSAKKTTWCIRAGMCTNWTLRLLLLFILTVLTAHIEKNYPSI